MGPTTAELSAQLQRGERRSISDEELERALLVDISRLPKDTRFPSDGEVYEALEDVDVAYMTAWRAPYTGGGRSVLPKGERVRVSKTGRPKPTLVYCDPLRYDELQDKIVDPVERSNPRYDSYWLCIHTIDLNTRFKLVALPVCNKCGYNLVAAKPVDDTLTCPECGQNTPCASPLAVEKDGKRAGESSQ